MLIATILIDSDCGLNVTCIVNNPQIDALLRPPSGKITKILEKFVKV